jgi:hypothetical protein
LTKENKMSPWEALHQLVYSIKSEQKLVPSRSEPLDTSGCECVVMVVSFRSPWP